MFHCVFATLPDFKTIFTSRFLYSSHHRVGIVWQSWKGDIMALVKVKRALVVGCGEFGLAAADSLSAAGFSVIVVDTDPAAFAGLSARFGGESVVSDGADVSVLEECDVAKSSLLVACTERDSVNYFIARVASEIYGVERVFARIEDEDLIGMLEDSPIEPICPHALCLDEFCRLSRLA